MTLYLRVPTDLVAVPASDFARALDRLAERFDARPRDRYAAGALSCGQWITGITRAHPLSGYATPCTRAEMQRVQMAADAVVHGWAWARTDVHRDWALGVATMVAWARGASRRPPIALGPVAAR